MDFKGKKILVSAGPTQEPLDPVRFITNPSTGKMGFALASSAMRRGGEVILVSGPTNLSPPSCSLAGKKAGGVKFIPVRTALQMRKAIFRNLKGVDVLIMAAAVSDYRPKKVSKRKIKKRRGAFLLKLEPTPDILYEVGRRKEGRILVGFSIETEDLVKNAKAKLRKKNLDLIVANDPNGFGSPTNVVKIIDRDGKVESLPRMSKEKIAERVFDRVKEIMPACARKGACAHKGD